MLGLGFCGSAASVVLITQDEAKLGLPPNDSMVQDNQRALYPIPSIEIRKPSDPKSPRSSPFELVIVLKAVGGAEIKVWDDIEISYLQKPADNPGLVDLVPRIKILDKPITEEEDGMYIRIPDAEIPAGRHQIRIRVKDTYGQVNQEVVTFNVR